MTIQDIGTTIYLFLIISFILLFINVWVDVVIISNYKSIILNDSYYFLPTKVYQRTKMNWFGCIITSMLLFIINFGYCSIVSVCGVIKFLLHVGRKKENKN